MTDSDFGEIKISPATAADATALHDAGLFMGNFQIWSMKFASVNPYVVDLETMRNSGKLYFPYDGSFCPMLGYSYKCNEKIVRSQILVLNRNANLCLICAF